MKIVWLKNTVMIASFLIAVGHAGATLAHSVSGALGKPPSATDVYRVVCVNDGSGAPHHLMTQVRDNAPVKPPEVSVVTTKGGASTTSTDPVDGNSAYSPKVKLNKNSGLYRMNIKKSAARVESYTAQFHCETSSGVHTGTSWSQTQNQ